MASERRDMMRDLLSVREQWDRLFNEFSRRAGSQETTWPAAGWTPPVDIHETADFLILKAELPGISAQDINIEIKDNTLVLQGERKSEAEVEEGQYHRTERMYGTFHRSFLLPTTIDQERAQANYKDGVLEVRLPKTATSQPKRITIGSYPP